MMVAHLKGYMPMGPQDKDTSAERRQHLDIREIFDEAYQIALPFLDPALGFGGKSLEHHVYVVVHEAFPVLTQQQMAVLVPALSIMFHERSKAR